MIDRDKITVEIREVLALSVPVILSLVGMKLMNLVDTLMVGHVSETALASVGLGNYYHYLILTCGIGVLRGLDPLVSQSFGAEKHDVMGMYFARGVQMACFLSIPIALLTFDAAPVLGFIGQKDELRFLAADYIRGLIPGIPPILIFFALQRTLMAMSVVRPIIISVVCANLVNLIADYVLIYGKFGFPAYGAVGCAYATSVCNFIYLAGVFYFARDIFRPYWKGIFRGLLSLSEHMNILRLGVPIAVQLTLETGIFMAVGFFMGRQGVTEIAGFHVTMNMVVVFFMVAVGISIAAATRVGNAIGRKDMRAAKLSAAVTLGFGVIYVCLPSFIFAVFPEQLAELFTTDINVIGMVTLFLPIAAIFQLVDVTQQIAGGVLHGAGDTKFPALMALIGFWLLGLPVGYYMAFHTAIGPIGLWWGLTIGLTFVCILLLMRIIRTFKSEVHSIV